MNINNFGVSKAQALMIAASLMEKHAPLENDPDPANQLLYLQAAQMAQGFTIMVNQTAAVEAANGGVEIDPAIKIQALAGNY